MKPILSRNQRKSSYTPIIAGYPNRCVCTNSRETKIGIAASVTINWQKKNALKVASYVKIGNPAWELLAEMETIVNIKAIIIYMKCAII
jgi:hypothetical protein